jgi:8-amino-7-oxononanoate synthase
MSLQEGPGMLPSFAGRLVTGDHPLLRQLEARLARRKKKPAALVFGSGYRANIGLPGALAGPGDPILIDELAHASMHSGTRLFSARVLAFRHNDLDHLADLLAAERPKARHALILTERVFSMDGMRRPCRT